MWFQVVMVSAPKYQEFWVWVLNLNQNRGFGRTLPKAPSAPPLTRPLLREVCMLLTHDSRSYFSDSAMIERQVSRPKKSKRELVKYCHHDIPHGLSITLLCELSFEANICFRSVEFANIFLLHPWFQIANYRISSYSFCPWILSYLEYFHILNTFRSKNSVY